jgi:uncharacterized membrane protein YjjB (DUF3815 family)
VNIIMYLRDVAVCFFAAFFYGQFMSVPVKPLIPSSLSAAFSYLVYRIIFVESGHELIGFLSAALTVSFVSEILARIYKMPATIFVMPGIIPLVPGVGLYRSMLCLVRNDIDGFLSTGVRTLFISGIIAVAIAVVNALARQIFGKREKAPDKNSGSVR